MLVHDKLEFSLPIKNVVVNALVVVVDLSKHRRGAVFKAKRDMEAIFFAFLLCFIMFYMSCLRYTTENVKKFVFKTENIL